MERVIHIKNLIYGYDSATIFDHFNLNINKGTYTTIVGKNGSGKSTLIQIMCGLKKAQANIQIFHYQMGTKSICEIRKRMGVLLENRVATLIRETVREELSFPLENLNEPTKKIDQTVNEIAHQFQLDTLINRRVKDLDRSQRQLVMLAAILIQKPQLLLLDQPYLGLDESQKEMVSAILKEYHEKEKATILQTAEDLEDALYGEDIVILDQGKAILFDSKEHIFEEEKILKEAGLPLPFMVTLSKKLKYYGLIDHVIFDMDEMVNAIWK